MNDLIGSSHPHIGQFLYMSLESLTSGQKHIIPFISSQGFPYLAHTKVFTYINDQFGMLKSQTSAYSTIIQYNYVNYGVKTKINNLRMNLVILENYQKHFVRFLHNDFPYHHRFINFSGVHSGGLRWFEYNKNSCRYRSIFTDCGWAQLQSVMGFVPINIIPISTTRSHKKTRHIQGIKTVVTASFFNV